MFKTHFLFVRETCQERENESSSGCSSLINRPDPTWLMPMSETLLSNFSGNLCCHKKIMCKLLPNTNELESYLYEFPSLLFAIASIQKMSIDTAEQMFELFTTCKDCSSWWNEKTCILDLQQFYYCNLEALSFAPFILASITPITAHVHLMFTRMKWMISSLYGVPNFHVGFYAFQQFELRAVTLGLLTSKRFWTFTWIKAEWQMLCGRLPLEARCLLFILRRLWFGVVVGKDVA